MVAGDARSHKVKQCPIAPSYLSSDAALTLELLRVAIEGGFLATCHALANVCLGQAMECAVLRLAIFAVADDGRNAILATLEGAA